MAKILIVILTLVIMSPNVAIAQVETDSSNIQTNTLQAPRSNTVKKPISANQTTPLRKTEIKNSVMERREEAKEEMREKRDEFEEKMEEITDERKKQIVENLDTRITNLNTNVTDRLASNLETFSSILERISSKAASLSSEENDLAELEDAIDAAQASLEIASAAVTEQAGKDYVFTIEDESTLRETIQPVITQFKTDIKAVHDTVKESKEAVVNAARLLGQVSNQ